MYIKRYIACLFAVFFTLLCIGAHLHAQQKPTKGQRKNEVSSVPRTKSQKEQSKSATGARVPKKGNKNKKASKHTGTAKPASDGREGAKQIGKVNNVVAPANASATRRRMRESGMAKTDPSHGSSGKEQQGIGKNKVKPFSSKGTRKAMNEAGVVSVRKHREESLGGEEPVRVAPYSDGKTRKAMRDAGMSKRKYGHQGKPASSMAITTPRPGPERNKGNKEVTHSLVVKTAPLDHRKHTMQQYRQEGKLMTARIPKKPNLTPKENPVEYRVISPSEIEKRQRKIAQYADGYRLPTLPHQRRIDEQRSPLAMGKSGKLYIARPANDRKQYRKIGREIASYQGDLRIKVYPHHPHPSLWRMYRNHKPNSAEIWRMRKLEKKPKYDPRERQIWENNKSAF